MNLRLICLPLIAVLLAGIASCSCGRDGTYDLSCEGNLYARGFTMTGHEGYTLVSVRDPWDTLHIAAKYILVPKNSALPDSLPQGILLRTPLENVAVFTSIYASILDELDCLDAVKGVCEPEYLTCRAARERVVSGEIADLGNSVSPTAEKVIDIKAEAIFASPFENASCTVAEKLGIPVIEAADYMESEPLGRCEWVRFYGRLFGRAAEADSIFKAALERYESLKSTTGNLEVRPKVLLEKRYGSSWFIPSGDSYVATLHRDAGADYIFAAHRGSNNVPLSSEVVFDRGRDADFWLFKYAADQPFTKTQLLEEYSLYGGIKAFASGSVYGCNTSDSSYYDDIMLHPDRILEDLIRIYHPQLLQPGELRYYSKLNE